MSIALCLLSSSYLPYLLQFLPPVTLFLLPRYCAIIRMYSDEYRTTTLQTKIGRCEATARNVALLTVGKEGEGEGDKEDRR